MKYEEYKNSGIEWIGEMPSHWRVMPIKRTGSFENGLTYSPTDVCDENGVLVLRSSNIQNDKLSFEDNVYVAKCPLSLMVKSGDIIICSRNGSASLVGKCAMVEGNINATYGAFMMRYRPICKSNKVFSYYLLQTALKCYKGLYSTTTINQLTKGVIGQIYVSYPPFHEQQAIATYLDEKCGEINRAIDVQKKKIDLLNELKQTIITDAVTKGLDPNIPMKDSGVQWIGKIPKHWKIKRTRFLCKIQTGDKDTVNRIDDGQYPFYVRSPKVERIDSYSFDGEAVLMAGDGVGAGKVFHYANGKFDYHQRVYNLHNFKDVSGMYYFYYISNKFKYIIEEGAAKNTVDSVRLNMIQDFWVTIPPLSEQQIIVAHIEKETTKIDSQITKANRRIELLEELKQSIITEAVTGKIKVC